MQSKSTIAVGLLAAAAPIVSAMGSANIHNNCNFPVYLWTVSDYSSQMKTIDVGGTFNEPYLINPNGGGVSMKIATNPTTAGAITQFEYTVTGADLWFDMSNIDGAPFMKWGFDMTTSDSSCRTVSCPAGDAYCTQVYNTPDENEATAHCFSNADTHVNLCSSAKHRQHHGHHKGAAPNPVPAPSPTTSAITSAVTQATPSVAYNNYGAAYTTFVTAVYTVTQPAPEATVKARHIHEHGHAHAHHRS